MKRSIFLFLVSLFFTAAAVGQVKLDEGQFRVFDGKGNPATLADILRAANASDAVFLGEQHDDAVGHAVQFEIFKQIVAANATERKVGLTLEMFERDVQVMIDEFLNGLIPENHFMLSTRPWGNYKWDYKPLVDLAKEKKLPVIAANAPRRYVNMVSRNGREALNGLSKDAKKWLPPLPFAEPSAAYATKFKALMGPSPEAQMGIDKILASQSLWDASMAYAVATFLKKNKKGLAVHLNGSFHTENRLGTVDHLLKYRSKTRVTVVTIRYEDDFKAFNNAKHTDLGDFVILTDAKQPRSKRN
jgi:uncharacterized iron-regulated protein